MSNNILETMSLDEEQRKIAFEIVKKLSKNNFTISQAKEIIEASKVFLDNCQFTTIS